MRDLSKSALSYSWAMSLFGVQAFADTLAPREERTRKAQAAFYSVTQAAGDEFNDLLWAAFQVGDELQREFVDRTFDFLTLRAFHPRYIARLTSDIAGQSRETLRAFTPGENCRLNWREFMNNYEVYNLVRHVPLRIPQGRDFPLEQLIEQAYALGAYPDLWAVEGLGHDYAATFWGQNKPIRNILTDERAGRLPAKSLTMLHAGMGLFFAQQLMQTITPFSPVCEIRGRLREFTALCRANSRKGYTGAAYESLGLVTRTLHAQMVPIVDRQLSEIEPEVLGYFRHGAGRALYFLPIYFVPGLASPWRAAEREAPHELGRLNMTAGLSWAKTIVNIRQPEIMENFLRYQGDQLSDTRAFTNGLMSSLIMGYDITPGDVYITRFLQYRPDPSDARLVELWNNLVSRPANDAVLRYYPVLKRHERLEEVFHYQDLAELVARLERE
jgi:hypothetical protein